MGGQGGALWELEGAVAEGGVGVVFAVVAEPAVAVGEKLMIVKSVG